jgi:hypothetical protein
MYLSMELKKREYGLGVGDLGLGMKGWGLRIERC